MKYKLTVSLLLVFTLVLAAGCVEDKPVKEIVISGQKEIYQFSDDLRSSVLVKSFDDDGIRNIFYASKNVNLVFEGSDENDNGYFRVVMINFATKAQLYLSYQQKNLVLTSFYHLGDDWYNSTDDRISKPNFIEPVLELKGPNTGATNTSVELHNNTIILQGTSYNSLVMAGDKLTLIVMGIDKQLIDNYSKK